ncbi:MAG: hypothetical protein ACM33T_16755 [Solirubrobacterales bacterium]
MTISRRALLGAALAGGSVAALGALPAMAFGRGPASASASAPLVLVDPAVDPAFGAMAAGNGGRVVTVGGFADLSRAASWLTATPGGRLVGLLSEADGLLLRQMVSADTRWLAQAHHCEGGHGGYDSRHQIACLPSSRGLGRHLAADLAAASADFTVVEAPVAGEAVAAATPSPVANTSRGWQAALGEALGLIAAGRWRADRDDSPQIYAERGNRGQSRPLALTSFVVAA